MRALLLCLTLLLPLCATAQTAIVKPDLHTDTQIAPAYFGPNAFPVPEMLDDAVSSTLQVGLSGRYHAGDQHDRTVDVLGRIRVPLFTSRANLVIWGPWEHYSRWTPRIPVPGDEGKGSANLSGCAMGTLFVSADVLLMRETRRRPAFAVRAAIKTASEDDWTHCRYYDCPGYFFDASFGKEWAARRATLRLAASGGFLCWQTDNGRQNDATMYGLQFKARVPLPSYLLPFAAYRHAQESNPQPLDYILEVSQDLRGYAGWERNGDCPMVLRTQATLRRVHGHRPRMMSLSPYLSYQKGLHDYPFQTFEVGLLLDFDILRKQQP